MLAACCLTRDPSRGPGALEVEADQHLGAENQHARFVERVLGFVFELGHAVAAINADDVPARNRRCATLVA